MIDLFKLWHPVIDYSHFSHHLHSSMVGHFEDEFADYVGAKHCIGTNSCTTAIFLVLWYLGKVRRATGMARIPTMIPPCVINAAIQSGHAWELADDPDWVGGTYALYDTLRFRVVDSAQQVRPGAVEELLGGHDGCVLYSFYPTKPVAGIDGGMVATNDDLLARWLRMAVMNGTEAAVDSWERQVIFPGWKAYLSSGQAYVAQESLQALPERMERIAELRDFYNEAFGLQNQSDHLYRLSIPDRNAFIATMQHERGIRCGIHYRCTHSMSAYGAHVYYPHELSASDAASKATVSIPYHEGVTKDERQHIADTIVEYLAGSRDSTAHRA